MPTVDVATGTQLYYESVGTGPAILLIQGVGAVGEAWRKQVEPLARDHRVVLYDNRGIGKSASWTEKVSVEMLAGDALALMDALDIEEAHVGGHSLGGVIAQQVALDAPGRVKSLMLMCTVHRGKDGARVTPSVLWTAVRMRVGTKRMRRAAFLAMVLPPELLTERDTDELAEELRPAFGRDLASTPPIVMKQAMALGRHDASSRLQELEGIPTLVLSADRDTVCPAASGRRLAAAIPGARYREITGAHGVPLMQPAPFNALLLEHLADVA